MLTRLVAVVRQLIGDTGASPVFSDAELEEFLVPYARTHVRLALEPAEPLPAKLWVAREGYWADGARVETGADGVTVASEQPIAGRWELSEPVFGPVRVTGRTYDVYAAAADALEVWAAREKLAYDVTVDGQSLRRSQIGSRLLELAQHYRRQARPRLARQIREDAEAALWS